MFIFYSTDKKDPGLGVEPYSDDDIGGVADLEKSEGDEGPEKDPEETSL